MTRIASFTSGESIYRALRQSILSLTLTPGQELKIEELAGEFGVSRSPVRDALMRLLKDDLVDIFPQRGTRVSLIDLSRVRAERFMRKSLEDHAIRAFVEEINPDAIKRMADILEKQKAPEAFCTYDHFLELDDAFHEAMFLALGMGFCFDLIRERCVHYRRIRVLTFSDRAVLEGIVKEHEALLIALQNGDGDLAAQIDRQHLSKLKEEQQKLLTMYPSYFTPDWQG